MTTRRMMAVYDRIAAQYAAKNAPMTATLRAIAADFMRRLEPDALTLDVGCGAGRDMAWFARHGVRVVGIDLSRGMLAQAAARVQTPLLQMDMRDLAFRTYAFSAVWCIAALLHLPKREAPRALAEIGRVLIPGGLLCLSVQEGEGEVWETGAAYGAIRRFFARYEQAEMVALLAGSGFTVRDCGLARAAGHRWLTFLATAGSTNP
ncbi:MAG: class I SAM-dependent methyltransferase [Chloroflexi bacterium]|nr:class I SAM-dependent methyltransferase [Chloroflexota bacterium]